MTPVSEERAIELVEEFEAAFGQLPSGEALFVKDDGTIIEMPPSTGGPRNIPHDGFIVSRYDTGLSTLRWFSVYEG